MRKVLLAILILALSFVSLGADTPASIVMQSGAWTAVFTASPDHDLSAFGSPIVTGYSLVVYKDGTPSSGGVVIPLGKPTPVSGVITANIDAQIRAITTGAGVYRAIASAVGPGGTTASTPSDPFELAVPAPRPTGAPGVARQ